MPMTHGFSAFVFASFFFSSSLLSFISHKPDFELSACSSFLLLLFVARGALVRFFPPTEIIISSLVPNGRRRSRSVLYSRLCQFTHGRRYIHEPARAQAIKNKQVRRPRSLLLPHISYTHSHWHLFLPPHATFRLGSLDSEGGRCCVLCAVRCFAK